MPFSWHQVHAIRVKWYNGTTIFRTIQPKSNALAFMCCIPNQSHNLVIITSGLWKLTPEELVHTAVLAWFVVLPMETSVVLVKSFLERLNLDILNSSNYKKSTKASKNPSHVMWVTCFTFATQSSKSKGVHCMMFTSRFSSVTLSGVGRRILFELDRCAERPCCLQSGTMTKMKKCLPKPCWLYDCKLGRAI